MDTTSYLLLSGRRYHALLVAHRIGRDSGLGPVIDRGGGGGSRKLGRQRRGQESQRRNHGGFGKGRQTRKTRGHGRPRGAASKSRSSQSGERRTVGSSPATSQETIQSRVAETRAGPGDTRT